MCSNVLRGYMYSTKQEIAALHKAIVIRIKDNINKVEASRLGEVLEFNVRLEDAVNSNSITDLQDLHKAVLAFSA